MRAFAPFALLFALLFVLPPAAASHWDATDAGDCALLGAAACRLAIRLSPAIASCDERACTWQIDCFWTIAGAVSRAEGTCHTSPWVQPCGTGACSGGAEAGRVRVPRGECVDVTMTGVGHGIAVDSTRLLSATSRLCA